MKTLRFVLTVLLTICALHAQPVSTLLNNRPLIGDGMAVDDDGNIFIASGNRGSIMWKVTPAGEVTEFASGFDYIVGVAVDADGNVFTNNYNSGELSKVSPSGVKSAFATGLNGPAGVAIDSEGFIYVTEFGSDFSGTGASILRFSPSGAREVFFSGSPLADVIGIAIDESNNVYATNFVGGQVYKILADSDTAELFATLPGNPAINQITFGSGHVYIPAASTNIIYRIDTGGTVEKFAGTGARWIL